MQLFRGLFTALITPFKNNEIDFIAFGKIIEDQITAGVDGIVVAGTTGESPTLSTEEHIKLLEFAVKLVNNRIFVIAGTGSNDTRASVNMSIAAEEVGCDGIMCVAPYYNKPNEEGLFLHYKAIHDSTSIPMMLYSVPSRVIIDFSDDLIMRIALSLPRVISIKDASGDMSRPTRIKNKIGNRLSFLSGNDPEAVAFNVAGGVGCISVVSNIFPKACKQIQDLCEMGDFVSAAKLQQSLAPVYDTLFLETNPICVKYAASVVGLCESNMRLPLTEPSEKNKELIKHLLLEKAINIG